MQRTYSVLTFGLLLLFQSLSAQASSVEYGGKVFKFRQNEPAVNPQSSSSGQSSSPGLVQGNTENQAMKELEAKGYVFRPMRKRKTLDDPPAAENPGYQDQQNQFKYESCPTPQARQRQQVPRSPVNPAVPYPMPGGFPGGMPSVPSMMPPSMGYPYTNPSPYTFPYPSGGAMPAFPGGFGFPGW